VRSLEASSPLSVARRPALCRKEEMSTPLLDLYSVKGNTIHGEIIATEARLQEAWWSSHRARKDRKLALALGAVPDKEPIKEPDVPTLALGKAAARPLEKTFGLTSSAREADIESASSELRDWLRDSGYFTRRPYHKKGMPSYYGRSLHSSSADGTDFSSRRG